LIIAASALKLDAQYTITFVKSRLVAFWDHSFKSIQIGNNCHHLHAENITANCLMPDAGGGCIGESGFSDKSSTSTTLYLSFVGPVKLKDCIKYQPRVKRRAFCIRKETSTADLLFNSFALIGLI